MNGKPPRAGEHKLSLKPSSHLIQDLRKNLIYVTENKSAVCNLQLANSEFFIPHFIKSNKEEQSCSGHLQQYKKGLCGQQYIVKVRLMLELASYERYWMDAGTAVKHASKQEAFLS